MKGFYWLAFKKSIIHNLSKHNNKWNFKLYWLLPPPQKKKKIIYIPVDGGSKGKVLKKGKKWRGKN